MLHSYLCFSLAAITTLYLLEASRYNQISQSGIYDSQSFQRKTSTVKTRIKSKPMANIPNANQNPYRERGKSWFE